ncbi:MAG TPA: hypothetical protein VF125_04200 [Solirubrobacterales bacterium]
MNDGARRRVVGVFPASAHGHSKRLTAALEEALPAVRFEPRNKGELGDLDGTIEYGAGVQAEAAAALGIPALRLLVPEPPEPGEDAGQTFGPVEQLDPRLHGAELPDARLTSALAAAEPAPERAAVLARCGELPTWTRRGPLQTALLAPSELDPGEALRERLCERRSAALLPVVHFLRELTAEDGWKPPAVRAAFLFDDPNLHWPSYGFVNLAELGEHAQRHGYHAALATIPLDGWYAHPRALRTLQESGGHLSLLVHGNDHYGDELGRLRSPSEALAQTAQALRRVRSFERRNGVRVDPVMVPPHEQCSQATVTGLRRCGFEAITMTQPFPWLGDGARSWLAAPEGTGPLVGWRPADRVEGLPVLLRHPLTRRSLPELTLRAFLDQPLILYGHQTDLLEGLDVLAAAVADVNRLGATRWCSLGEIAATSFEARRRGSSLAIRPLNRRARVEIPADVEEMTVEPALGSTPQNEQLIIDGRSHHFGEPVDVAPGSEAEIVLRAEDAVEPENVPAPRRRPLAMPRRILSESRDRLAPLLSRAP